MLLDVVMNKFGCYAVAAFALAMFEAVNAVTGDYEPYLGTVCAKTGASADAAAVAAAHRVLSTYFPAAAPTLDAARVVSLAAIPDGQAEADGIAVSTPNTTMSSGGRSPRFTAPTPTTIH